MSRLTAQYIPNYDSLTFEERLLEVTDLSSAGIHIGLDNFDSSASRVDIIFQLHLPGKALNYLLAEFGSLEYRSIEKRNTKLIFRNVHLKWNAEHRLFFSTDTTLVLYQIGENVWNKPLQAGISFQSESKFHRATLYLEFPDSSRYFFHYRATNGLMTIYSTDTSFMDVFAKGHHRDLFYRRKYACKPYTLSTGSMSKLDKFLATLYDYRNPY